jgi:NADP-dependent 3-hydroxy acid dehydrogenase YdfG
MSVTTSHQIHGLNLLDSKVAVIYGAAGGIGTAVAKAFAREGATVFLAGRTENTLNPIAQEIKSAGGVADISKVDALSPESVEAHLQKILAKTGKARRFFQPHRDKRRHGLQTNRTL